jgi:IS1 family transposase
MNKLDNNKRVQVVAALVEGNSIRATVRMTGVAKNTIVKLLADLGMACAEYQDKVFRNLTCKKIQCDEIWSFVGSKQKNVPDFLQDHFGIGDVWTWVSMDADTKLVPCWLVGDRSSNTAMEFIHDLADRLANKVQLTTDGHKPYLEAVESAFGGEIDYAQLVKIYGGSQTKQEQIKYSPAECIGCKKVVVTGNPRGRDVSTSYIERQNLTMRMSMRRFTRLTNGFSKKVENHAHAIALHYMYYNFVRMHKSLRCTPAMAANVTSKLWSIEDIIEMAMPYLEKAAAKRGPYKKKISN